MKETTPGVAKPTAPAFNKRTIKDSKDPQQATSQETERTHENRDKSSPKKKIHRSTRSTLESADFVEATTAGAGREIGMLLSQFAEVLRGRAAAETAQMKKLQGYLTEAQNLESSLKEKKNHLRQTLARISDNLKG